MTSAGDRTRFEQPLAAADVGAALDCLARTLKSEGIELGIEK
jgi:hypothetical protein